MSRAGSAFFERVGRACCVCALLFTALCAVLFLVLAVGVVRDPHPAFTLPPDSTHATTPITTTKR